MNCELFQKQIRDFIFDKIEYSEDLEEFLRHSKECGECREELELYYTIHRGLEEVQSPVETDEPMTAKEELEYIFQYYSDYFKKEKLMKQIGRIFLIILAGVFVALAFYVGAINI